MDPASLTGLETKPGPCPRGADQRSGLAFSPLNTVTYGTIQSRRYSKSLLHKIVTVGASGRIPAHPYGLARLASRRHRRHPAGCPIRHRPRTGSAIIPESGSACRRSAPGVRFCRHREGSPRVARRCAQERHGRRMVTERVPESAPSRPGWIRALPGASSGTLASRWRFATLGTPNQPAIGTFVANRQ